MVDLPGWLAGNWQRFDPSHAHQMFWPDRELRKILTHLGEPLEPPPVSPARGPPTYWAELVQVYDDRAAPPEAHESLVSRKTGAEVPLTGLSFANRNRAPTETLRWQQGIKSVY